MTLSFGASSTLAQQIDQGAAADIFMSADTDWMDFLQKNGRIADGTRKDLLGNRLVLVAGSDAKPAPRSRRTSIWPARWATAGWPWPTRLRCRRANMARRR